MKYPILALACVYGQMTLAQVWCAPGAQWRYELHIIDPQFEFIGIAEVVYPGDTLINGVSYQLLRRRDALTDTTGQVHIQGWYDFHTRVEGDLVFFRNPYVVGAEDTLVWWNAVPGSVWDWRTEEEQNITVTVMDTGLQEVGTEILRYVDIQAMTPANDFWEDRFLERIGFTQLFSPSPSLIYFSEYPLGQLLCYEDTVIEYGDQALCSIALGGTETQHPVDLSVYPNPGAAWSLIGMGSEAITFNLLDVCGRLVLSGTILSGRPSLDVRVLTSGLYTLWLVDARGGSRSLKWMKE